MFEEKNVTKKTAVYYTGLFLVMTALIYGYFVREQKSFIWEGDGFSQHYLVFKDYLSMWRGFLSHPTQGFPFWDWNIGLGSDVIASYGYYVIGDPFVYLGLLFPEGMTELAYHVLVLARVYVVGLAFLAFCRQVKIKNPGALFGSILYTFTFYVVLNVVRHPFFLLPMISFPLLCLGMDRILRGGSNSAFILAVFFSAFSNFYFFYMLTVLVFIFAITRYFNLNGIKEWKSIFGYVWRALYSYTIGVLMAGILLAPVVWGFLHSSRQPGEFAAGLKFYPFGYYLGLVTNLLVTERFLWTVFGFAACTVLLAPLLFLWRKKIGYITANLSVFAVILLLPAFGSMMNGFSGPYNRWTFAIPLFISAGSAILFNERFNLTRSELKAMGLSAVVFSSIPLVVAAGNVVPFRFAYIAPVILAWLMWALLVWAYWRNRSGCLSSNAKTTISIALVVLAMANLIFNARDYYQENGKNEAATLLDYGTVDERYKETFGGAEQLIKDPGIYRIGVTSKDNNFKNQMALLNLMGMNSYLSVTNGAVADFAKQLENNQFQLIQPVRCGFDDRRIINNLLGVKYILTEAGNAKYLPDGYKVVQQTGDGKGAFVVAQSDQAYPFAYAESVYLSTEEFEKYNPVEKEAFLSYGIVLEPTEKDTAALSPFEGKLDVKTAAFSLASSDPEKVQISGDTITVKDGGGTIELLLNDPQELANAEVYVHLKGLHFEPNSQDNYGWTSTGFAALVSFADLTKEVDQSDILDFSSYFHRDNMLFNMGSQGDTVSSGSLSLQLNATGTYKIDDIKIYAYPFDGQYAARVSEKQANALAIKTFTDEKISGTITQAKPSVLTTTIPYTPGWKAEVNGKAVGTVKVNYGFIGIPLSAGESEVTLTYQTPFLKIGSVLSISGLLLLFCNQRFWNKKRQSSLPQQEKEHV
jgi:uncharacterized membrane protein YfhO